MKVVSLQELVDADEVLKSAVGRYREVLVIGWDQDGILDVAASSTLTAKDCSWLVDRFKVKLLSGDYTEDEK